MAVLLKKQVTCLHIVENFSGEFRVRVDHHQAIAIKIPDTYGPLLRQADADLPERRRS